MEVHPLRETRYCTLRASVPDPRKIGCKHFHINKIMAISRSRIGLAEFDEY